MAKDVVGRDDRAGARHVLHHDAWMTGDILAEISRDVAGPEIEKIPRLAAANNPEGFLLEKIRLRLNMRSNAQRRRKINRAS